jgi:hypothetical protein
MDGFDVVPGSRDAAFVRVQFGLHLLRRWIRDHQWQPVLLEWRLLRPGLFLRSWGLVRDNLLRHQYLGSVLRPILRLHVLHGRHIGILLLSVFFRRGVLD